MSTHADIDRIGLATLNLSENITAHVKDISPLPIGHGGYSDIHTAVWHSPYGDMKVAVKVIRTLPTAQVGDEMPRVLRREISIWKKLRHRNIHMLCGLYNGIGPAPALISPWCEHGDINAYLRSQSGDQNIEVLKLTLFLDVLSGVKFLHDNKIVHGDIKGANILISEQGVARLCDFGLSSLLAEHSQSITHTSTKGSSRWMAPELLGDGARASYLSDVWACGCLLIEVWSAVKPYHTKTSEHQVLLALFQRETPPRPNDMAEDYPWSIIAECCVVDPLGRRSLLQLMNQVNSDLVLRRLTHLITMGGPLDNATSEVLNSIIHSLCGAADPAGVVSLYTLDDSDFAARVLRYFSSWSLDSIPSVRLFGPDVYLEVARVLRYFSSWSLDSIPSVRLFGPEVYLWCLSAISDHPSPSVSTRGPTSLDSRDDSDEDERLTPHILRPVARLLAAVDPALADRFIRRFASATLLSIPFESELMFPVCVWLSGDNRIAVSVKDVVRIWDFAAHATVHDLIGHTKSITCLAVSPNRSILASGSHDESVRLWDVETGRPASTPILEHSSSPLCMAFPPDGLCIASGTLDGTIRVWRTTTRTAALSPLIGHEDAVNVVAYSSDGSRIVSGSRDGSIRLWDASTGDRTRVIRPGSRPCTRVVFSIVFSPDSSKIVSGSDGALHIWNAVTGDEVTTLVVERVLAVAYSPNGSRIASGSVPHDRVIGSKVRIWDAADGSLITEPLVLREGGWIYSLQFSLDGSRLLSFTDDGIVRILDATEDWKRWDI